MSDSTSPKWGLARPVCSLIGCLTIATSVTVLAGWMFHLETLKALVPGQLPMKANTAIAFVAAGVALLLQRKTSLSELPGKRRTVVAMSLSCLVVFLGAVSLLEQVTTWDLGIDQLLFRDVWRGQWRPGLMSPLTAVAFLMLGTALLVINSKSVLQQVLSLGTFLCGLFGTLDFLFDPQIRHLGIAVNTSIVLMVLPVGVVLSRPDDSVMTLIRGRTMGGKLVRWMLPAAVILPMLVGWLEWEGTQSGVISNWFGVAITALVFTVVVTILILVVGAQLDAADQRLQQTRTEAQQALQRVASIVTSSDDAIISKSKDGIILTWNKGAERLYGYTAAEAIGQSITLVVPPALHDELHAEIQRVRCGDSIERSDSVRVRKDGTLVDVSVTLSPLKDHKENITGICSIVRDITEKKRAEAALSASEERYRSLVLATSQIVWTTDGEGQVIGDMPLWRDFTGLSVDDLQGWGWINSVHPDDRRRTAEIWKDAVEARTLYETEYRLRRRDGEYRYVAVRGAPVLNSDGTVREWIGTCTDITERKQTDEALRKASLYARSLLEASLDPLVTIDRDGHITDVNRATEEVTGIPRDSLIGSDFSDYFTEPQKASEGYRQVFAQGLVRDYPLALRHTSGHVVDVVYNATLFRNEAGEIEGAFAAARDITERKRAEEELARRAEALARSNAELEQFAYVASHDLQEPLRMVASYTQLLAERYRNHLDSTADKYIAYAVDGAQRMQTLINDLLALSRVTTRASPFAHVDLNRTVREVCGMLATSIQEKNARVEAQDLPTVMADATQMHQLLQNLIGNALKFQGDKPPLVRVCSNRSGDMWAISVQDNGIGLDPQYADRIFLAFQRLHTRTEYPGNGIGLAICKKIAERHGGRIWVESREGEGAKFVLTVPVHKVTDSSAEIEEPMAMTHT